MPRPVPALLAPTAALTAMAALAAQTPPASTFAPPVRIEVAGKHLGNDRLYPSPVLHDVDGDGRLDLVVGDLRGRLTTALREASAAPAWRAPTKVLANDGKELDFANW